MSRLVQLKSCCSAPWLLGIVSASLVAFSGCGSSAAASATANDAQVLDGPVSDTKAADAKVGATGDTAGKADSTKAPCKPWEAAIDWNCPADTHCGYDESDVVACVPNGSHSIGEDCADGAGCKIGLCVTSDNGTSACSPYCTVESQCDSNTCNKIQGKKYSVCDVAKYTSCAPLTPKCPSGQSCYDYGSLGFVCANAGSLQNGEACVSNAECAPGYTCAGAAGSTSGLCRKLCSTTAKPNGCDDPSTNCSKLGAGAGYCEQ